MRSHRKSKSQSAATTALLTYQDTDTAIITATNAVENNYVLHAATMALDAYAILHEEEADALIQKVNEVIAPVTEPLEREMNTWC